MSVVLKSSADERERENIKESEMNDYTVSGGSRRRMKSKHNKN